MTVLVAGVDEAGRGPVIGPLVIAIAVIDKDKEQYLKSIGVKDSKMLTPERREELVKEICQICKCHVAKITAKQLNEWMKVKSLNQIEADAAADLIFHLPEIDKVETIYIDSPDPVARKFVWRMNINKKMKEKIHASHKADVIFPICSAASIVAKTTRDAEIEKIKKELGCNFNTGYSHDAATIKCLEDNIENPTLRKYLRMEWSTTKRLLEKLKFKTKQVKLDDF
jgi:ribonuclease HII